MVTPTARIVHRSLVDGLLIAACSAYVCWSWLIEPAPPMIGRIRIGITAALLLLAGTGLAIWAPVGLWLRHHRRHHPGPSSMVLRWAPVSVAILACLAHLVVFHNADTTSLVIAMVIGTALGWSQALTVRDLRDHASQLEARESMFRRLAHTDPLTGLGNRRALDQVLARQTHPDSNSVVLFIDLDGFKVINDTRGHDVGDRVLQRLADRIRANIGSDDFAARFGGDEFVLVLRVCPERAVAAAHRWFAVICAPYLVGGAPLRLSASIGFARCGEFADACGLIRCADLALRRAKSNGKGRIEVYEAVGVPASRAEVTDGAYVCLVPA